MRQKLLIIDDSQMIHSLVKARLGDEPIDIHSAHSGVEGIARAVELQPDMILLDVEMPQMDGFATCHALKSRGETMAIPIVFLTGVSSTDEKIKGLELGAVDYVTKPFDAAELRARVRATLRTKYLLDLLSRKAQIDGLTGLWNRGHFDNRLARERSLANRSGHSLAVVMADIDKFKSINDRHGHPAGDQVLKAVSKLFKSAARAQDLPARYGGEEMALILPGTDRATAAAIAESIRRALAAKPVMAGLIKIPITASFGVATYETALPFREFGQIIKAADMALYAAKHGGRNNVKVFSLPKAAAKPAA